MDRLNRMLHAAQGMGMGMGGAPGGVSALVASLCCILFGIPSSTLRLVNGWFRSKMDSLHCKKRKENWGIYS